MCLTSRGHAAAAFRTRGVVRWYSEAEEGAPRRRRCTSRRLRRCRTATCREGQFAGTCPAGFAAAVHAADERRRQPRFPAYSTQVMNPLARSDVVPTALSLMMRSPGRRAPSHQPAPEEFRGCRRRPSRQNRSLRPDGRAVLSAAARAGVGGWRRNPRIAAAFRVDFSDRSLFRHGVVSIRHRAAVCAPPAGDSCGRPVPVGHVCRRCDDRSVDVGLDPAMKDRALAVLHPSP